MIEFWFFWGFLAATGFWAGVLAWYLEWRPRRRGQSLADRLRWYTLR